jgi:hypothetical protein
MSQLFKDIHRDLIIADPWTEPHSPWQNPAELNGVEYLKSHAQVLLDRAGSPDNLCFLIQDKLSHVHNLSANRQLNWKIPEQISGKAVTSNISRILMFFFCHVLPTILGEVKKGILSKRLLLLANDMIGLGLLRLNAK